MQYRRKQLYQTPIMLLISFAISFYSVKLIENIFKWRFDLGCTQATALELWQQLLSCILSLSPKLSFTCWFCSTVLDDGCVCKSSKSPKVGRNVYLQKHFDFGRFSAFLSCHIVCHEYVSTCKLLLRLWKSMSVNMGAGRDGNRGSCPSWLVNFSHFDH